MSCRRHLGSGGFECEGYALLWAALHPTPTPFTIQKTGHIVAWDDTACQPWGHSQEHVLWPCPLPVEVPVGLFSHGLDKAGPHLILQAEFCFS